MIFSGTTPNDIYEWIEKKNNGDDTYYLNGKQDTEEAIDVFQSLYRCTFKNVYRLFIHLQQHLCMRVADSQSFYRAFIVLRTDEIITIRLSQHFSTKDAAKRAFNRIGKPNVEYHLTINRVKPLNTNTDIYYDRTLSNVEIKVREYDLSEFNDRDIRKGIIDEIIALLTYGTNKSENKQYMNMNKQVIRLTEGDLHKIIKESVNKILCEAYGTPSTNDATQLQKADDAQNMFAKYGGGKFKDRDLYALTTIAQVADTLHYNSHFLPPKYEEVVERMAKKLKTMSNYLQNKVQMNTGLQPTTWNNFMYNESDLSKTVKKSVNEVMYNGRSYHGNNAKDWLAINKYRKNIADKYYNNEMNNLTAIRNYGHRQFNEPEEELPYPNNSIEGLPNSTKNSAAMSRNTDNAIDILSKGTNNNQ